MPVAVRLAALPMLLEHGAWAHSDVLRTRNTCECASRKGADGAYSMYAESDAQRWGSHAGLSPAGMLGSRDWVA